MSESDNFYLALRERRILTLEHENERLRILVCRAYEMLRPAFLAEPSLIDEMAEVTIEEASEDE